MVVTGVAGMAVLGSIAKVPSTEYWTVVLGAAAVGAGWMSLLSLCHFKCEREHH